MTTPKMKIVLFANTEWYLYNFRLSLAKALRAQGHDVILLSPDGPYGEKLRELGFRWEAAPMERLSLNPLRELALILWVKRFLTDNQVDLIHGFTIKCAVYGGLAGRLAGTKAKVSSVAGLGFIFISQSFKARLLRPVVRRLLNMALGGEGSKLILQNADDVDLFTQSQIVEKSHIVLIRGSGVDCEKFTPSLKLSSTNELNVVLPARMLYDKGVEEFVIAARLLKPKYPSVRFCLAGAPDSGNPASVEPQTLESWQKEGAVDVLGHVDDVVTLFQNSHITVLPSYREGLPKGLIEAAACESALITTDVPGCREVVDDRENGLLVPARNASALATAIEELLVNRNLRDKLAGAARQKAIAEFEQSIVLSKTLAVYRSCLKDF